MKAFIIAALPGGKIQVVLVEGENIDHFLDFPEIVEARSYTETEAKAIGARVIDLTVPFPPEESE